MGGKENLSYALSYHIHILLLQKGKPSILLFFSIDKYFLLSLLWDSCYVFPVALFIHLPCNNNHANKQIVLDLWKLTDKPAHRYSEEPKDKQQTIRSMSATRQVYLKELVVGGTYLDRVE